MSKIFPIGGGKGGVGKTFIAASLGAFFARQGARVVLVDLDLGAANLHTFLSIKNPQCGIDRYLSKEISMLEHAAVPTAIPNLYIISSLHCSFEIANLFYAQKRKIIQAIRKLSFDYILLDLGPGTNYNTLDFFLSSNNGVLVIAPDLPSIENTFRFIKAVYLRKLKQIIKKNAFTAAVKQALADTDDATARTNDIIKTVLQHDPEKEAFLKTQLRELRFSFIINFYQNNIDPALGSKIETVCNRHFYSTFEFLGTIRSSERISDSVLPKNPFVLQYPDSPASIDLKNIADKLLKL